MLKADILKRLKEAEGYISGQELCDEFGVSRTAVWKAVNALKNEGFVIDSVSNKGYLLKDNPDVLTKSELESSLKTSWIGKELYCYDEIDSTNTELKRIYDRNPETLNGAFAVTDNQTLGRGRRGRAWETPKGENIAMSFMLRPEFAPDKASMLTILAALSVAKGTEEVSELKCQIKWPNDVLIDKKKYCGILTEMSTELDFIHYVIVGIGINANTTAFPKELTDTATSIYKETGVKINRAALINAILKNFEQYYENFEKEEGLGFVIDEYNARLASMDSQVKVLDPVGEYEGISRGINSLGELIVEKNDGDVVNVYAGEVSVRGIYGYA